MPESKKPKSTSKKPKEIQKIKSSVFSRSLSLAQFSLQAGAKFASHRLGKIVNNQLENRERWLKFITQQANLFSTEVGQLKGSLMKAGQMLSVYGEHLFPPEVNQFLKTLQNQSAPVSWTAMEKIIKKEFSADLQAELEIDSTPLASASMGQVHKATIKSTGEVLALKIQYPNVDKAIDSDLRAIKSFLNLLKVLPKEINTEPIFAEIREMLVQETNYEQEALLTATYGKYLKNDPRFIVPKVYSRYSTNRILATEFIESVPWEDDKVRALSQENRNQLARNILELYFQEIFQWGFVQTDPHAGNYRIQITENKIKIVLLDFGATKKYSEDFLGKYRNMISASVSGNQKTFFAAARKLEFLRSPKDDEKLEKLFEEFCFMIVEPFVLPGDPRNSRGAVQADGSYDWKNTDLPKRTSDKAWEIIKAFAFRTPPREILFLDRKTGGIFILISLLNAKINGREILDKYLQV